MEEPHEIGDWTRIAVLGSGGFGTVTLWQCAKINDSLAVKKCRLQCPSSLSTKQRERWCNEVQIMKEINHANIVKYKPLPFSLEEELNKYNPTKLPLLSMEYCQKGNLRHTLNHPTNLTGLKEEVVRDVLLDIGSAVSYLHDLNITHRDIKPDNIVLQDSPERRGGVIYKLIDLGYAKELHDATVSFVGTLYYLAPEIFANKKYDYSVDYWSLGVLTFEVVCGVLPFCTTLTPVERFHMIKNKGPADICIYKSNLGKFEYSTELFKENQISSCLKTHLEIWLQRVLQFNPAERVKRYKLNIFEHLSNILNKRIVKVFSAYRYDFFSYEFDESTTLCTVRDWIARDMNIYETEQLLLGSIHFGTYDDQTLLIDCLPEEKQEIFVFKRTELFNKERYQLPRLVKLMFEKAIDTFNWRDLKAIYSHAVFYISQDIARASAFSQAMDLFIKHLRTLLAKVKKRGESSRQKVLKLMAALKGFNDEVKGKRLNEKNILLGKRFLRLYSSMERCVQNEYHLAVNIAKWDIKMNAMEDMYSQIDIVKLPQLQELLKQGILLLQVTGSSADGNNNNLRIGGMSKIICNTLELKDKLVRNDDLQEFSSYLGKATNHLESLMSWINLFDAHIENLSKTFKIMKADAVLAFNNFTNTTKNGKPPRRSHVMVEPKIESALKNHEILISRLEDSVTESLADHQKICDDISTLLSNTLSVPL